MTTAEWLHNEQWLTARVRLHIEQGGGSRLILQVHDEVIVEVPPDQVDEVTKLTVATMADAAELRVPLEVNVTVGSSWAAAKG